ncbi:hypothetical protein R6Z07F_020239 [Ovis aries]
METVKLNDHEPTFTQQMAKWIEVTESPRLGVQFQVSRISEERKVSGKRSLAPLWGHPDRRDCFGKASERDSGNQEATAAKKSCSAVCFEDERKKEDPLATELQRQREGTKYDHEGQKTSERNLEKENPVIRHSVEEGEENKRTKLFSPFLCT